MATDATDASFPARQELVRALRSRDTVQEVDFTRDGYRRLLVRVDDAVAAKAVRETAEAGGYKAVKTTSGEESVTVLLALESDVVTEKVRCGGNRL